MIVGIIISSNLFSQDIITPLSGDEIVCDITGEDSTTVYFKVKKNGKTTATFLAKSKIKDIKYEEPIQKLHVGKLELVDGTIVDEEGVEYVLSKEVTSSNKRSIYVLNTIPDEKLDEIVEQYDGYNDSFRGADQASSWLARAGGFVVGTGLCLRIGLYNDPNWPEEQQKEFNKEYGNKIMLWGGVATLGTIAIFLPIQMNISKNANKLIQNDVIDVHNNSFSALHEQSIKLGINLDMITGNPIPSLKLIYRF